RVFTCAELLSRPDPAKTNLHRVLRSLSGPSYPATAALRDAFERLPTPTQRSEVRKKDVKRSRITRVVAAAAIAVGLGAGSYGIAAAASGTSSTASGTTARATPAPSDPNPPP